MRGWPHVRIVGLATPQADIAPILLRFRSPEFGRFRAESLTKEVEYNVCALLHIRTLEVSRVNDRGHRFGLARLLLVQRSLLFLQFFPLRDVSRNDHQELLPILAGRQNPSLRLEVHVVSGSMPEPIFDSAPASGQH